MVYTLGIHYSLERRHRSVHRTLVSWIGSSDLFIGWFIQFIGGSFSSVGTGIGVVSVGLVFSWFIWYIGFDRSIRWFIIRFNGSVYQFIGSFIQFIGAQSVGSVHSIGSVGVHSVHRKPALSRLDIKGVKRASPQSVGYPKEQRQSSVG